MRRNVGEVHFSHQSRSGEFTSPNGGVKPPLHQFDPLPEFRLVIELLL
jgi:hypothetical protein